MELHHFREDYDDLPAGTLLFDLEHILQDRTKNAWFAERNQYSCAIASFETATRLAPRFGSTFRHPPSQSQVFLRVPVLIGCLIAHNLVTSNLREFDDLLPQLALCSYE